MIVGSLSVTSYTRVIHVILCTINLIYIYYSIFFVPGFSKPRMYHVNNAESRISKKKKKKKQWRLQNQIRQINFLSCSPSQLTRNRSRVPAFLNTLPSTFFINIWTHVRTLVSFELNRHEVSRASDIKETPFNRF